MSRSSTFYREYIILTIISIFAANMWVMFAQKLLKRYTSRSIYVDFVATLGITVAAIIFMTTTFSVNETSTDTTFLDELFP